MEVDLTKLAARREQAEEAHRANLRRAADYIYNDPPPVVIDGYEFTVQEIKGRRVMTFILQFVSTMNEVTRHNLAAMLAKAEDKDEILRQIDPGRLLLQYFELSIQVISESTAIVATELEDLPGSTLVELGRHVVRAHTRVLERFFAGRGELMAALAVAREANPETNGHSSRPASSPASLTPDSTTPPSGI